MNSTSLYIHFCGHTPWLAPLEIAEYIGTLRCYVALRGCHNYIIGTCCFYEWAILDVRRV